jgi:hypothetical protein
MPSLKSIIPTIFCLLLSFCTAAKADTTYTYTGKPFTTFRAPTACPPYCSIDGSFTVATALGDNLDSVDVNYTSFAFVEPTFTVTQANSHVTEFNVSTDATGAIDAWFIALSDSDNFFIIGTTYIPTDFFQQIDTIYDQSTSSNGYNLHDPGTWRMSSSNVPEPATGILLIAGLVGLAGLALKKSL